MRTLRTITFAALSLLVVSGATPAAAADKCAKTIAAEIKKVAVSNFRAALKGGSPKSLNAAKLTKACASGPPAGYQGCPGIGACVPDTKKDNASYQACLTCLIGQTAKDVDRRTTPGTCGNGTKDAGEDCDTNAACATGTCGAAGTLEQCTCSKCGDHVVQPGLGETCDGTGGCRASGTPGECTSCGDGVVDAAAGETCDGTAGCRAPGDPGECTKCGDGHVDADLGETCDGTPGCRADCTACGDGIKNGDEACDPQASPNGCGGGGCSDSCECLCGNGVKDAGEDCDPAGGAATSCSGAFAGFRCGAAETGPTSCACQSDCTDFKSLALTLLPGSTHCAGQCTGLPGRTCFTDNGCAQEDGGSLGTCNGRYCSLLSQICTVDADCTASGNGTCVDFTPTPNNEASGAITYSDASTGNLGKGCLYFGGGNNRGTPPAPIPNAAIIPFDLSCQGANHFLVASAGSGPASCTKGVSATKHCIDGTLTSGQPKACTADSDCTSGDQTAPGRCAPDANCYFGPPLPIAGGIAPTCLLNIYATDANGTIDPASGTTSASIDLFTRIFISPDLVPHRCFNGAPGNGAGHTCDTDADCNNDPNSCRPTSPCPVCANNICVGGLNHGQPCTPVGTVGTTLDCPLDPSANPYASTLSVSLGPLTTGTSSKAADGNGNLCGNSQRDPGAFGQGATQGSLKVTAITENGASPGNLSDGNSHDGVLAYTFCIPATMSPVLDPVASLPGPGALGLPVSFQLTPQGP